MNTESESDPALIKEKIDAEILKILAETSQINRQTMWYPVVITAGLIGAAGTIFKYVFA